VRRLGARVCHACACATVLPPSRVACWCWPRRRHARVRVTARVPPPTCCVASRAVAIAVLPCWYRPRRRHARVRVAARVPPPTCCVASRAEATAVLRPQLHRRHQQLERWLRHTRVARCADWRARVPCVCVRRGRGRRMRRGCTERADAAPKMRRCPYVAYRRLKIHTSGGSPLGLPMGPPLYRKTPTPWSHDVRPGALVGLSYRRSPTEPMAPTVRCRLSLPPLAPGGSARAAEGRLSIGRANCVWTPTEWEFTQAPIHDRWRCVRPSST
jgi:hypothetical protein